MYLFEKAASGFGDDGVLRWRAADGASEGRHGGAEAGEGRKGGASEKVHSTPKKACHDLAFLKWWRR